jgi:hypothetical protein
MKYVIFTTALSSFSHGSLMFDNIESTCAKHFKFEHKFCVQRKKKRGDKQHNLSNESKERKYNLRAREKSTRQIYERERDDKIIVSEDKTQGLGRATLDTE